MQKPSEIRIQKDLAEFDVDGAMLEFPNPNDIGNMVATLCLDEGIYAGARISFSMAFRDTYPFDPPKVKCMQRIYHPNIDYQGHVCLNILRQDWNPILSLQSIVLGLQQLLLEPNGEEPLDVDIGREMVNDSHRFRENVSSAMRGQSVHGKEYDACLNKST